VGDWGAPSRVWAGSTWHMRSAGTSMASMQSIGLASSSSCRTAHLQNDGPRRAYPATCRRKTSWTGAADSPELAVAVRYESGQVTALGAGGVARLVRVGQSVRKSSMWAGERVPGSASRTARSGGVPAVA
jgi:hypothetical protein